MVICEFCQCEYTPGRNTKSKYCSLQCQANHRSTQVWDKFLTSETPETYYDAGGQIRKAIRSRLLKAAGYQCQECGWSRVNPHTGNVPLEVDHIDGDWSNCAVKNLRVVCPNCHSVTASYKALNKGKGREYRRKVLQGE